jgi:filamentous hemagglutinin
MAGKDIDITAGQVDIINGTNTYHNKEDHEYKKSGLTVSLGGGIVNTVSNVVDPIKRAGEVEDGRLKALYGKKAYDGIKDVNKEVNSLKTDGIKGAINLNVGIGSTKSESHSDSTTTEAAASNINATAM